MPASHQRGLSWERRSLVPGDSRTKGTESRGQDLALGHRRPFQHFRDGVCCPGAPESSVSPTQLDEGSKLWWKVVEEPGKWRVLLRGEGGLFQNPGPHSLVRHPSGVTMGGKGTSMPLTPHLCIPTGI